MKRVPLKTSIYYYEYNKPNYNSASTNIGRYDAKQSKPPSVLTN